MKKEKTEGRRVTDEIAVNLKSRQFYGFMGVNDYDEASIEELTHDSEEGDYYYGTG
jgi:hypothetical protein